MIQTVIGMFDNAIDAQNAVQKLCNNGFSKEHIEVTSSGLDDNESGPGSNDAEGGISGFFKNLFSNREDSDKYVRVASYSESIVSVHVHTKAEAESAAEILDACGAINVDDRAASLHSSPAAETGTVADESTERLSESGLPAGFEKKEVEWRGKTTRISIMAENLHLGKSEILSGGTRLHSRIIEPPLEARVTMREEAVGFHRTSATSASSYKDLKNFTPQEIELVETAEVPIVSKEARVVEEVRIGKEISARTETVSDTVRRTEIDVEDLDKDRV